MGAPRVPPSLLRARPGLRRLARQLEEEAAASEARLASAAALLGSAEAEYHRALLLRSHVLGARSGAYDALADAAALRAFCGAQAARLTRALAASPGLAEACGWEPEALPHAEALRRCRAFLAAPGAPAAPAVGELLRGLPRAAEAAAAVLGAASALADARLARLAAGLELRAAREREEAGRALDRLASGAPGALEALAARGEQLARLSREAAAALRALEARARHFEASGLTAAAREEYQSLHCQRESLSRLVRGMGPGPAAR